MPASQNRASHKFELLNRAQEWTGAVSFFLAIINNEVFNWFHLNLKQLPFRKSHTKMLKFEYLQSLSWRNVVNHDHYIIRGLIEHWKEHAPFCDAAVTESHVTYSSSTESTYSPPNFLTISPSLCRLRYIFKQFYNMCFRTVPLCPSHRIFRYISHFLIVIFGRYQIRVL